MLYNIPVRVVKIEILCWVVLKLYCSKNEEADDNSGIYALSTTNEEDKMKHNIIEKLLLYLICIFFIFSFSGCTTTGGGIHIGTHPPDTKVKKGGPPPHAKAHGYRAKHTYQYYPSASVYFDAYRKVYFYLEGDNWRMSVSLPQNLRFRLGDHVTIEMDTDKPYTSYEEHKRKYPPGQLKKKKKK